MECTACELGHSCSDGIMTICPHLHYADSTASTHCRKVPVNYKIDGFHASTINNLTGGQSIAKCGENQYTDALHWECKTCDNAHMCTHYNDVVPCPHGQLKIGTNWFCSP